jgi:hypothetical protein
MSKHRSLWPWVGVASGLAVSAAYLKVIRPWMLTWGSSVDERRYTYPGERLVRQPRIDATLATTIQASPLQVWPWLAQLGQDKGGFYSYDWLENLMGLDIHNANAIVPQWQNLRSGQLIMLAPDFGVPVVALEPNRYLVMHGDTRLDDGSAPPVRPGEFLEVLWGFYLYETPDGRTRLVSRWIANFTPTPLNRLFYHVFLEPGAFLMLRRMLLGIKERAEQAA